MSRDFVDYNQYGAHNVSATDAAAVSCPVSTQCVTGGTCKLSTVTVAVYDRSTTANVACTLRRLSGVGVVVWSQTRSSTGGGPTAVAQSISFSPNGLTSGIWNLECSLPASQSGSVSHLVSFWAATVE